MGILLTIPASLKCPLPKDTLFQDLLILANPVLEKTIINMFVHDVASYYLPL